MKYSIRYCRGSRVLDTADELIIKYNMKDVTHLLDFIKTRDEKQRIVVDITQTKEEISVKTLSAAASIHKNFAVLLSIKQTNLLPDLDEACISFFFAEGAGDLDTLAGMLNLGVSDVYIINELGFFMDKIKFLCKNVNIRVYPNVAQSSTDLHIDNFKKFYIRPEDVAFYEEYVDVMEFFGPLDKQAILYEIYKKGVWNGDLNDLILGLKFHIDNQTFVPYFGKSRTVCNKRCAVGRCGLCDNIKSLSETLERKGLGLRKKKNEYNTNEETLYTDASSAFERAEDLLKTERI